MGCSPTPTSPQHVSIILGVVSALVDLADDFAGLLKSAEAEVLANQERRRGKAGSLRAARRIANRKAGAGPDPKRFDRPASPEQRKARKRLRRKLARAR